MCDENNKYLVFLFKDGVVNSLIGFSNAIPSYSDLNVVIEPVRLPPQLMLGRTYQATIIKNSINEPTVGYIPLNARPLAL